MPALLARYRLLLRKPYHNCGGGQFFFETETDCDVILSSVAMEGAVLPTPRTAGSQVLFAAATVPFLIPSILEHHIDYASNDAEVDRGRACRDLTSKDVSDERCIGDGRDVGGYATDGAGLGGCLVEEACRFHGSEGCAGSVRVFEHEVFASGDASVGCPSGFVYFDTFHDVGFACAGGWEDGDGGGEEGEGLGGSDRGSVHVTCGQVGQDCDYLANFVAGSGVAVLNGLRVDELRHGGSPVQG